MYFMQYIHKLEVIQEVVNGGRFNEMRQVISRLQKSMELLSRDEELWDYDYGLRH